MPPLDTKRRGFSLVELLIIVAILGILAAIGSSSFVRYLKQSKSAEVSLQLKALAESASRYYQLDHYDENGSPKPAKMFPTPNAELTDTTKVSVPDTVPRASKILSPPETWQASPWKQMKFNIVKPHYFQYGYRADNTNPSLSSFTGFAHGDLDGDTVTSMFIVIGQGNVGTDELRISPIIADPINPLE